MKKEVKTFAFIKVYKYCGEMASSYTWLPSS